MRREILTSVVAGVLALAIGAPANAEGSRTETAEYVGTTAFTAGTGCLTGLGDDPNLGGACFFVDEDESTVTVSLDDISPLPVGGDLSFIAGSELVGSYLFCDSIEIAIPEGSSRLIVSADTASGALSCLGSGGPTVAGTITATFEMQ